MNGESGQTRNEGLPETPAARPGTPAVRRSWGWVVPADGRRLRALRRQLGLTQQMLADRAGVSQATVARLENGPRPTCRGRTLARLATTLGTCAADMLPLDPPVGGNGSGHPALDADEAGR